jgi:hypothetical protein
MACKPMIDAAKAVRVWGQQAKKATELFRGKEFQHGT